MDLKKAKQRRRNQRVQIWKKSQITTDPLGGETQDLDLHGEVWAAVESSAFSKFATTYQMQQIINPHGVDFLILITNVTRGLAEKDVIVYKGVEHDVKFIADIEEKNEMYYIYAEKGVIKTQDETVGAVEGDDDLAIPDAEGGFLEAG